MNWLKRLFGSKSTPPPEVRPGRNEVCWCGSGVNRQRCSLQALLPLARIMPRQA